MHAFKKLVISFSSKCRSGGSPEPQEFWGATGRVVPIVILQVSKIYTWLHIPMPQCKNTAEIMSLDLNKH